MKSKQNGDKWAPKQSWKIILLKTREVKYYLQWRKKCNPMIDNNTVINKNWTLI
jgi:hypothetical protein